MLKNKIPQYLLTILPLAILSGLYVFWCSTTPEILLHYKLIAFVSIILAGIIYIRFVPSWINFWCSNHETIERRKDTQNSVKVFCVFLIVDIFYLLLIAVIQKMLCVDVSMKQWLHLDSDHYINIARDGYIASGDRNRMVELVFLPGYPFLVRLLNVFVGNYFCSGMILSGLSFGALGSAFYNLLRLDFSEQDTFRTLKYFLICPGIFFFVAPMSESLFLFLCILCIYYFRTGKPLLGGLLGAYAAFTRSSGIALLVPVLFEVVHYFKDAKKYRCKQCIFSFLSMLIIPIGFIVYLLINWSISGNLFQFLVYQSEHWGQNFGYFFASIAHQFERIVYCIQIKHSNLFGCWLPNFISSLSSLIVISLTAKKLRTSYTAYFIAYYFVVIGATALMSAPRYLMSCFPVFIAVMLITKNKRCDLILSCISVMLAVVYAITFVLGLNVW